jgi:hypothetical protein
MQTIPIANEKLITPKQLRDARVISLQKQFEEREAGRLKCIRIGKKVLYRESHITEYLNLCERGGNSEAK